MIMMMFLLAFFILVNVHCCTSQQNSALPAIVSPAVVDGTASGVCPSAEVMNTLRNTTKQEIKDLLRNTVNPKLDCINGPPCSCGNRGEWTRIAFLNMTDPSQQCPTNWGLITSPVRACGRSTIGGEYILTCDSAFFSSNGHSYSHVCRVDLACPCTNTEINWPYQVPFFVGNNYFCDNGNIGPSWSLSSVHPDDPLWDGQGCGPTNACCELNTPPWFCTTLPQPTSDDIELRICGDQHRDNDEDVLVNLIDIYVM